VGGKQACHKSKSATDRGRAGLFVVMSFVQRDFSTALSSKDIAGFNRSIWRFVGIIVVAVPLYSFYQYMQVLSRLALFAGPRVPCALILLQLNVGGRRDNGPLFKYELEHDTVSGCRSCLVWSGGHG
jgi:hypothetical protein